MGSLCVHDLHPLLAVRDRIRDFRIETAHVVLTFEVPVVPDLVVPTLRLFKNLLVSNPSRLITMIRTSIAAGVEKPVPS